MLKHVINRLMHAFFHKALWLISVTRDANSPDMKKGMH